jgi:prepilin-type N-terminal cleavage/methylation domain-containing protein
MKRRPETNPGPTPRCGLTLLEVLLALSILAISLGILAQLVNTGMRAAREARDLTHAQLLCESLMAEMTSGSIPPTATQGVVPTAPDWVFSSVLESAGQTGMVRLVITVQKNVSVHLPVSFSLARIIRDPSLAIPTDEATEGNSSSSSSSTSAIHAPPLRRIV